MANRCEQLELLSYNNQESVFLIRAPSRGDSDNEDPLITKVGICHHSQEEVAVNTSTQATGGKNPSKHTIKWLKEKFILGKKMVICFLAEV